MSGSHGKPGLITGLPDSLTNDARVPSIILLGAVGAAGLGSLAVVQPLAAIGAVGVVAAGFLFALGSRLTTFFLGSLLVVLSGYAFFGRGFAYLGAPPVFVGEFLLSLAVLTLVVNIRRWRLNVVLSILLLFMVLGLLSTVPYLATYSIDALRDAVIWVYAIFAITVTWIIRRSHFASMTRWYSRLLPVFVVWAPIAYIASEVFTGLPTAPGSSVSFVDPKGGDIGVHLAGGAAFILTGLWARRSEMRSISEFLLWPAWFFAFVLAGSVNRGGLLAATVGIVTTLILRPSSRLVKPAFIAMLLISLVILIDPQIDLGKHRQISVEQITINLRSVVFNAEHESVGGTREWRLRWWGDIVDYTVHGPYFWTGKGFGINLADADGYQVSSDGSLRSPHNSHMTVLARMGVPGMVVWIMLQISFALVMLASIRRAYRQNDTMWIQILVWLFVYWLAMILNSSFDVYLEGPQAGIWFWTIFGLGLAACRLQKETQRTNNPDESGEILPHNVP